MIGRPDTTDHRRRCRLLSLMVRRLINCVSACVLLALAYPRSPRLRRETGTLGSSPLLMAISICRESHRRMLWNLSATTKWTRSTCGAIQFTGRQGLRARADLTRPPISTVRNTSRHCRSRRSRHAGGRPSRIGGRPVYVAMLGG